MLSGIQSMLQPTMAPSSFPESISPAPSSTQLPLLQAAPGLLGTMVWHVWGQGERVCPMKWLPQPHLGSMGLEDKPHLPGRADKHKRGLKHHPLKELQGDLSGTPGKADKETRVFAPLCALLPQHLGVFSWV